LKRFIVTILFLFFFADLYAQQPGREIKLSALFSQNSSPIFDKTASQSLFNTVNASFILTNDFNNDTAIYYSEGYNDWFSFTATPVINSHPSIQQVSGRQYFGKVAYDYLYYPAQKLLLKAGSSYKCIVQCKGSGYFKADTSPQLLTPHRYYENKTTEQKIQYTNNIITYFFVGAICFGFFLFLFLYYKSRYSLFGLYAAFLFFQGIYGFIMVDVYTTVGNIFITHFNWDKYVTDFIIFAGQAVYLHFAIGWLKLKENNIRFAKALNRLSIFFAIYAVALVIFYLIFPAWRYLLHIRIGVRLLGLVFQFVLFYNIIFKIKSTGRWYIFAGSIVLMLMGLLMVFFKSKGWLDNTFVQEVDNASWYMIGIFGECLCFTLGLGQHYFELQNKKNSLHIKNLEARQLVYQAEENNLKNRLRISQDLHDILGSTLGSISVYSEVAKIHDEKNEKAKLNELLEKISGTSNEMIAGMNDIVWAIDPKNDNMEKIIERMESFARPLATEKNIQFDLECDNPVLLLQMDMDKRKNFFLIFKEAVKNAIKYSAASELTVDVTQTNKQLKLIVKDNGIGFNVEGETTLPSANGIKSMYVRADQLKGALQINSQVGKGTLITLTLPLN
jgi:signal transduction histidine kinase